MEGLVTSSDPEFSAYRPGLVVVQSVVRDAYESGRDFDFRVPPSGYKMRWADRVEEYASFDIACSAKGVRYVTGLRLCHWGATARRSVVTLSQIISPQGYAAVRSGMYAAVPRQCGRDLSEHVRRLCSHLRSHLRDRS